MTQQNSNKIYCTKCGEVINEGQLFCGKCGTKVDGKEVNQKQENTKRLIIY
ncbi:MAG: zinc-ribbon domain-containing protein [Intestinibacter bartlettii]